MNDEFLHQIRVEPPPDFIKRLKSRLDLQPPPSPARPHSKLGRILLGLLLTGSVFALTLFLLNRGSSNDSVDAEIQPRQEAVVTTNKTTATAKPESSVVNNKVEVAKKETPPNFTIITPKSLQPYMSYLTDTYFKPNGNVIKVVITESPIETFTQWCRSVAPGKSDQGGPVMALVTRQMAVSDSDICRRNAGGVGETAVGYQALVQARSKLYGTFNLTPTELFLALAAEVPDPARPGQLIPNPNPAWSDVNGALEREPIEIFGPDRSSMPGLALREILLESGCRSIPALANVKKCPDLRSDSAYTEVTNPYDIAQQLQTKPNAVGILPFGATQYAASVDVGPIGGVMPSMKTISTGTYPGARALYIYMNAFSGGKPTLDYLSAALPADPYNLQRLAIIPPERSQQ
jgi:phosphate transport system substrate-binding protein